MWEEPEMIQQRDPNGARPAMVGSHRVGSGSSPIKHDDSNGTE